MDKEDKSVDGVYEYSPGDKKLLLPLRDGNEAYTFNSVEELESFIANEHKEWAWLENTPTPLIHFSRHLKTNVVNALLDLLSSIAEHWKDQNIEALNDDLTQLSNILTAMNFPFLCRSIGDAISRELIRSEIVAMNMLYLACTPNSGDHSAETTRILQKYDSISEFSNNGRVSTVTKAFLDSEGFRLKANRILGRLEILNINGGVSELTSQLENISKSVGAIQKECEESFIEFEGWKASHKSAHTDWIDASEDELRGLGKRILKKYVRLKRDYFRRSAGLLEASEETVEKARQIYHSQIELDSAVEYWRNKRDSHRKSKNVWLVVLIGLLLSTGIAPFVIFQYLPVENFADDKLLLNIINPITLITSILVISLLSFTIRMCSRQFSTQQHLFLEAVERMTMLKTYLALMNENKLTEQEDRKIALDALFRPAKTGIIADHGSIVPSDTVVKIIDRQSTPSAQ